MNARLGGGFAAVVVVALCACQSAGTAVKVAATAQVSTAAAKASKPDLGHGPNTDELAAQMGEVGDVASMAAIDAEAHDADAVLADCADGKSEVRKMQALLVDYAGPATDLTNAGLAEWRAAFDACLDGDITSAIAHLDAGTAKINAATAEMGQS